MTRKMSINYEPYEEDGEVIGCDIRIIFAEEPKRSKKGEGPNLMDFTTGGSQSVDLGNDIAYKCGINFYHPVD